MVLVGAPPLSCENSGENGLCTGSPGPTSSVVGAKKARSAGSAKSENGSVIDVPEDGRGIFVRRYVCSAGKGVESGRHHPRRSIASDTSFRFGNILDTFSDSSSESGSIGNVSRLVDDEEGAVLTPMARR